MMGEKREIEADSRRVWRLAGFSRYEVEECEGGSLRVRNVRLGREMKMHDRKLKSRAWQLSADNGRRIYVTDGCMRWMLRNPGADLSAADRVEAKVYVDGAGNVVRAGAKKGRYNPNVFQSIEEIEETVAAMRAVSRGDVGWLMEKCAEHEERAERNVAIRLHMKIGDVRELKDGWKEILVEGFGSGRTYRVVPVYSWIHRSIKVAVLRRLKEKSIVKSSVRSDHGQGARKDDLGNEK